MVYHERSFHNYYVTRKKSPLDSLAIVILLTHTTGLNSCADMIHKTAQEYPGRHNPNVVQRQDTPTQYK